MRYPSFALAGLLSLALVMPAAAKSSAPWLHVRVTDADGVDNVNLNVPFSLAEALLQMAEQSELTAEFTDELPDGLGLSDIRKMWNELKTTGDTEFLSVQSGDEEVRMAFEGDSLLIDVTEPKQAGLDTIVKVRVPTSLVDALLSGQGEELNLRAALEELRDGHLGDLVHVQDGDETVRVWME